MKKQLDKKGSLYGLSVGIGGGILGSALVVAGMFGGQAVTNATTLIAGLGGGVISGLLTLLGVRRTIELQKAKEDKDLLPQKILALHNLKNEVDKYCEDIFKVNLMIEDLRMNRNFEKFKKDMENYEKDCEGWDISALQYSLNVDGDVYKATNEYIKKVKTSEVVIFAVALFYENADMEEAISVASESYQKIIKAWEDLNSVINKALEGYRNEIFK